MTFPPSEQKRHLDVDRQTDSLIMGMRETARKREEKRKTGRERRCINLLLIQEGPLHLF